MLHFEVDKTNEYKHKDGLYTGSMNHLLQKHGYGKWCSTDNDLENAAGYW